MHIPVCTPVLAGNEIKYVNDAVESGWISSSGTYVPAFERAFAAYCGARHAIAVCNGTAALHLALTAMGIGPGDEVVIPDFTMAASAFAVCHTGASPVFIDSDATSWNIDVSAVESAITPATKAIMPVHIFGNPCAMQRLNTVAKQHNLLVLEDAAQAHGATYNGKRAGALGDIAAFSFFANKNITTGEGGMVVTNDDTLAERCRYFKNLCFPLRGARLYLHEDIGFNYRMSNMHAALGLAQTEKAEDYRTMRIRNGLLYRTLLSSVKGIAFQEEERGGGCVYWMNGILVHPDEYGRSRDELTAHLARLGIETRNFFNGMHRQPALKKYGCDCNGSFPVSDRLADNGCYLPSGSGLTEDEITYICEAIRDFSGRRG